MALDGEDAFAMHWYSPPEQPSAEDPDPFNTLGIAFMEIFGLPHSYVRSSARSMIDSLLLEKDQELSIQESDLAMVIECDYNRINQVFVNLLVDLSYAFIDPRIRLKEGDK